MSAKYSALVCLILALAPFVLAQRAAQPNAPETEQIAARAERVRQRQEEFRRLRVFPGNTIPSGARAAAIREMERMIAREKEAPAAATATWTMIGPRPTNVLAEYGPVGNGSPFTSGRVAALAVDPRNAAVAYTGASGGGVWKTTDGGQNWVPLTDSQPSLATCSIALAPSNPDIVYVGTGEQNNSGDSYYGAGVLKSLDGGATWTQFAGPFVGPFSSSRISGGGSRIGAMAVHPTNPDVVLAAADRTPASSAGIYRTTNGGADWTLVLGGAVGTDVVFNPADPTIVYAALGASGGSTRNGIYKSTDAGATWDPSIGSGAAAIPAASIGRVSLALAPSSPNTIFASIQFATRSSLLALFRSTDGAQSWTALSTPDYCNPQCSYNNVVRVHPTNPSILVAAGLPPYRSLNGGATWTNIAVGLDGLAAHTDHHALAFSADGNVLYDGSDGGVFSTNPTAASVVWTNLNTTLAITEFDSNVSIHPSDPRIAYAGTQDNGTQKYTGTLAWDEVAPGDGGFTAIDPAVPSIWYGTTTGPSIYKQSSAIGLVDPFSAFTDIYPYLTNGLVTTERFLFYPAIAMDPSNPLRLYVASQRLYQTNDGAGTWTAISPDLTATTTSTISAIGISPANPQVVAVGTSNGRLQVTNNASATGGPAWTDRSAGLPGRSVSHLTFDPVAAGAFYVTVSGFSGFAATDDSGHVFKTADSGQTWTNISGNLPNIPVNDIVVDPDLPGTLYVATDIGVFQSSDGGQSWATLSNGLPRVLVPSLNLHRASRTLRAVTYGRSMWDLSLPLVSASAAPRVDSFALATLTVTGSNFTASSVVRWNGVDRATTFVSSTSVRATIPDSELAKTGRATLLVFNPFAGSGLSNSLNVPVGGAPDITAAGVVSAAAPALASPLVPGSIYSLYARNLAPSTVVAGSAPLPYTLGGAVLEISGIPAPLSFVSPNQANFQVPWDLEGHNRASLTAYNGTQASVTLLLNVAVVAPAIFTMNGRGTGQGAVLIAGTGVLAAPVGAFPGSRPARPGDFLEIYATGLGPVSRLQTNGTPKPVTTAPAVSRTPSVTIGGAPATVLFSGLAPNAVGVYQINVQVPAGAATGDAVPVVMSLTGTTSNAVTIAIAAQ